MHHQILFHWIWFESHIVIWITDLIDFSYPSLIAIWLQRCSHFSFLFFFLYWSAVYGQSRSSSSVQYYWHGWMARLWERDRKRSDYRKRPILDEPTAPLLIIPRYIVAPHCNNVWCIHKERTPTQRAQRLHHQATSVCRVCFLVHTRAGGRAVAREVCIPLKSVERTDSGCRSHDGKRGKERKSYMHVRRTWSPCDRLTGVKVLLMAYPIHAERSI